MKVDISFGETGKYMKLSNANISIEDLKTIIGLMGHNPSFAEALRTPRVVSTCFDYEALYKLYPKPGGKARGLEKLRSQCKDESTYRKIEQAIRNYTASIKQKGTESKYIKQFDGFMSPSYWTDWVEVEGHIATKEVWSD